MEKPKGELISALKLGLFFIVI